MDPINISQRPSGGGCRRTRSRVPFTTDAAIMKQVGGDRLVSIPALQDQWYDDALGRLAQLVRALPSHGRGHWFKSSIAHSLPSWFGHPMIGSVIR